MAPFSPTHSARSLGSGNSSAEFGNANSNYYLKAAAGIGDNMDVGYVMEFGSAFSTSGLFAKYSILNNEVGPAVAIDAGYGSTDTTTYYYGGVVASLAFNESFEFFLNGRINQVSTDSKDIEIGDSVGNMTIEAEELTYILGTAGFNIWMSKNLGISFFGTQAYGNDIVWDDGLALGGSFMIRL